MANILRFPHSVGLNAPRWPFTLNKDSPLAQGLVAWWPMLPANVVRDLSGNGNDLTQANVAWKPSVLGRMAPDFDGSSSTLKSLSSVISGYPFTMAAWFISNSTAAKQSLVAISTDGQNNHRHSLEVRGDVGGDKIRITARTTGTSTGDTSTGYSLNRLHHACAVGYSTTDRRVFIDGGSRGTSTINRSPSGMDVLALGHRTNASPDDFFNGLIPEAAIWNVAKSDEEVFALSDPATRWDMYYELGRVTYFFPVAAPAAGNPYYYYVSM